MIKPNALVIGPMKAGTTWLHDFLAAQGNVCLPDGVKETFFFDRYYRKGDNWYTKHFKHYDAVKHELIMEIAPSYFHSHQAPQRIREVLGEIPIIITLRDPVLRTWSHYLHLRRYGYTTKSLRNAVLDHPQLLQASRYSELLQFWSKHFSQKKMYVVWQEDLQCNPGKYAQTICSLVNIKYYGLTDRSLMRSNEAAAPPSALIAALGRKAAYTVRSMGLYNVVNYAKSIGLKRFFFGAPGGKELPTLTEKEAIWLVDQLQSDFMALPQVYQHPSVNLSPDSYFI